MPILLDLVMERVWAERVFVRAEMREGV